MSARPSGACPVCGSPKTRFAFTAGDWQLSTAPGPFTYRRCSECATVYAEPQPSAETLATAYASDYGNYRGERGIIERLIEPLAQREAQRLMSHTDPDGALLDVGCGNGRFLERLQRGGWRGPLGGVEYSPETAAATSARLGVPVAAGTAEDLALGSGELGTLVLRHVIEHLRDPATVLDRLRPALVPGGVLYLATPDVRALAAAAFGRYWQGYEVPRHLVVFSRDSLRTLVRAHGFEVEREWWAFSPQMWNASVFGWLNRGRGRRWPHLVTHLLNPLVTGPAVVLGAAEVLLRRSTMYAMVARVR